MLGSRNKKKLKTKAAETRHLIPFCIRMCEKFKSKLDIYGTLLVDAGQQLGNFQTVLEANGRVLELETRADIGHAHWLRYLVLQNGYHDHARDCGLNP